LCGRKEAKEVRRDRFDAVLARVGVCVKTRRERSSGAQRPPRPRRGEGALDRRQRSSRR
jgi:hypothetical protein